MNQPNGAAIRRAAERVDPQVLLVDYFDTLVSRRVPWWAVRLAFARQLGEHYGLGHDPHRINTFRARAERRLGQGWVSAGFDPEPRLDEIVDEMWSAMKPVFGDALPDDRAEFQRTAIELDLAVEGLAQVPDDEVLDAVKEAAAGRVLAVVSDFYLPQPHFGRMLEANGLRDLPDHVFVSCEARLSKKSGRHYAHVIESLEAIHGPIERSRVLMIGDNTLADGERAEQAGLATCPIVRPEPTVPERLTSRIVAPSLERRRVVQDVLDEAEPAPFLEIAVTLFVFIRRLHERARQLGIDTLAFQAREGQFLLTLFERYQELVPSARLAPIDCRYLVVSRRSTAIASLAPLDDEAFDALLSQYDELSFAGFLGSLGFEPDAVADLAAELGGKPHDPADIDRLRGNDRFRAAYEGSRTAQSELLRRYVAQTLGSHERRLDLVDVGWKGTIQDNLQRALGSRWDVHGHYLGVVARSGIDNGDHKHGLLFDSRAPEAEYRQFRHFKALYEYVLQADHGSAARYREDGADVVPELDMQELEAAQFDQHVRPLQRAVLQAFTELCRADSLHRDSLVASLAEAGRYHTRMLYFPRRAEVDFLMSLRFYENYGEMAFGPDGQLTRRQKIAGILDAVARPRAFLQTGWPPFHLAALGLRPLIPVLGAARLVRERLVPSGARRACRGWRRARSIVAKESAR